VTDRRFLVIEHDNFEGAAAVFKKIYIVDLHHVGRESRDPRPWKYPRLNDRRGKCSPISGWRSRATIVVAIRSGSFRSKQHDQCGDRGDVREPLDAPACGCLVRLALPLRVAPREIRAHVGTRVAGRALLRAMPEAWTSFEAFEQADRDDVLVIDNGGRTDEGCIGDLVAMKPSHAHRRHRPLGHASDSADLQHIRLPTFSCGVCPNGPLRARERELAP
jgi:hypothetical protein